MVINKALGFSIAGIAASLASLVLLHQNVSYVRDEIFYPDIEPLVIKTIKANPQEIAVDSMNSRIAIMLLDTFSIKEQAIINYLKGHSLMDWNSKKDTNVRGYHLKYENGVFYTMYRGWIFETNYRRSTGKFYLQDPYKNQVETLKEPEIY